MQAALLDAPQSTEAWQRWQKIERLDAIDQASWKMLPQAYLNLTRSGVNDALLMEAREVHRHYWARNQRMFHQTGGLLDELKAMGVPVLIVKGAALAALYYQDAGARPMEDFDLLVPIEKYAGVGRYLWNQGWKEEAYSLFESRDPAFLPSFGFEREDGLKIDLHGHLLHIDCRQAADVLFWAGARPFEWQGRTVLTLRAEDHFFHAICHGLRWNDVAPIRWMADAWQILRDTGERFNWERVVEQTREHRTQLHIARGLADIIKVLPLPVPDNLIPRLQVMPSALPVRIKFACGLQPHPISLRLWAGCLWRELEKNEPETGWRAKLQGLISYLMDLCHVHHPLLIPWGALRALVNNRLKRLQELAPQYPPLEDLIDSFLSVRFHVRKSIRSWRGLKSDPVR